MEIIKLDCPICDDGQLHDAEVIERRRGTIKVRSSEFEGEVMIVRCLDCGTVGIIRKIESIGMESYEFPYEVDL